MKVLGIGSSPREGNTNHLLRLTLGEFKKLGYEVELVLLKNLNIQICDGCLTCEKTGECHLSDDMRKVYSKLDEADIIVFATPCYFESVSSLLKIFIDRTCPCYYWPNKFRGKGLMLLVVGEVEDESKENTVNYVKTYAIIMEMNFLGFLWKTAKNVDDLKRDKNLNNEIISLVAGVDKRFRKRME